MVATSLIVIFQILTMILCIASLTYCAKLQKKIKHLASQIEEINSEKETLAEQNAAIEAIKKSIETAEKTPEETEEALKKATKETSTNTIKEKEQTEEITVKATDGDKKITTQAENYSPEQADNETTKQAENTTEQAENGPEEEEPAMETDTDSPTFIGKETILEAEDEVQKEAYLAMIANVEEQEVVEMSHRDMLLLQLRTLIEQEKIYLKAGLKLDEVAQTLGTNRTYVTKMMTELYNKTFTEQMNLFRLQSAQQDLLRRRSASIEDIALSNGFNSANTFNKVFNQHFKCSPAVWRSEHPVEMNND